MSLFTRRKTAPFRVDTLTELRWPKARWSEEDRPVAVINAVPVPISTLTKKVKGDHAYIVGIKRSHLPIVAEFIDVGSAHFYDMQVSDVSPVNQLALKELAIEWNTKITDITPLAPLRDLEVLAITDTRNLQDISPIAQMRGLKAVQLSGGIWTKNVIRTLEPIAALPEIEELVLRNVKVVEGDLRSLGRCSSLKRLRLPNTFPTEQYAYLSVALPEASCEMFAPYVHLDTKVDDADVMVVGSRKPFLNSKKDKERLQKYAAAFAQLQDRFRRELSEQHG